MSDVNAVIQEWRQDLQQTGGLSADEVAELESHLVQEIDVLQKSGLRPDEAFLIASRRLGHPCELAVEYSKNETLMSWRRPARLVLWGLLLLQLTSLSWSVLLLFSQYFVLGNLLHWQASKAGFVLIHGGEWITLALFWTLTTNSQGRVARVLARLEEMIQSLSGTITLILGTGLLVLTNCALRILYDSLRPRELNELGFPVEQQSLNLSFILELIASGFAWTGPVVVLLAILIWADRPVRATRLATR